MFEDMDFGGVGGNTLDIIKEFLTTKDPKGKTRLNSEQIRQVLLLLRDIRVLQRYYGQDFEPLADLLIMIEDLTEYSISLDGKSREEAQKSLQGLMSSEGMQTNIQKLTENKELK